MRWAEREYLAFDTTSISFYSELIKQAKYGKNKEGDVLPQINLGLLYGEKSRLPVYYRKMAGNTPDVVTIQNLLKDIDFLEMEKLSFVMDRGFFSERNINDFMKHHYKFLIGARCNLKLVRKHLDQVRGEFFTDWKNFHEDVGLYAKTFTTQRDYTEKKARTGEVIQSKKRVYLHLYFNPQRCVDEQLSFTHRLMHFQQELQTGKRVAFHEGIRKIFYLPRDAEARPVCYSEGRSHPRTEEGFRLLCLIEQWGKRFGCRYPNLPEQGLHREVLWQSEKAAGHAAYVRCI